MSRFGTRPYDELSQIRAIHRALVAGLFYIPDPRGLETLRDGRKLATKMLRYFNRQGTINSQGNGGSVGGEEGV